MNKNAFKKLIENIQSAEQYVKKCADLNFDIFESPLYDFYGKLLDEYLKSKFSTEIIDTIYWWLFEDVEHIVTLNNKKYNLKTIDDLYRFILKCSEK